jgi:hypothetical protein
MALRSSFTRPTRTELIQARLHNLTVFLEQQKTKRFCAQDYIFLGGDCKNFWLKKPGTHGLSTTTRKSDDIIAGAISGVIPFDNADGDDGLLVNENGTTTRVELKLAMKVIGRYFISKTGAISCDSKVSFRNDVNAYYEIVNNLMKKKVRTHLVILDSDTWEVVEILALDGKAVYSHLKYNQNNGKEKTSRKRSIPMNYFVKNGWRLRPNGIDVLGIETWEDRIYARDGVTRPEGNINQTWTTAMVDTLLNLASSGMTYTNMATKLGVSRSAISNKLSRTRRAMDA